MRLLSILFIFIYSSLLSQNFTSGDYWVMDRGRAVDFTAINPVPNTTLPFNYRVQENNATLTDASSTVVFHTDGEDIFDATGFTMLNGINIGGHESNSQLIAFEYPGTLSDSIIVFTVNDYSTAGELRYSIADMTGNGGLGEVVTKGALMGSGYSEHLTGVFINCNEAWVIAHKRTGNFEAYFVDTNGIGSPVISSGIELSQGTYNIGCIKLSHDNTKLAGTDFDPSGSVVVYDFDITTGNITNPTVYPATDPYGLEFSPNGNLLYYTERGVNGDVRQIDLTTGVDTRLGNGSNASSFTGQMELGRDGKIYVAVAFGSRLNVINNPDISGTGCNYVRNGLFIGGSHRLGLPQTMNKDCPMLLNIKDREFISIVEKDDVTLYNWFNMLGENICQDCSYMEVFNNFPSGIYIAANKWWETQKIEIIK